VEDGMISKAGEWELKERERGETEEREAEGVTDREVPEIEWFGNKKKALDTLSFL